MIMGKHGVDSTTPDNIPFGAGTFHKNLAYEDGRWTGTCVGATSGGGKFSMTGEYVDLDIDGALVLFKGQTVKAGGKASMELSLATLSSDNLIMAGNLKKSDESDAEGYDMFVDKPNIEEGDYIENFAYVGKTANGAKDIIIIFDYAFCRQSIELEGKNKAQSILKLVMEAYAENDGELDTLPVRIYYPTDTL